jgi:hypothetical protein
MSAGAGWHWGLGEPPADPDPKTGILPGEGLERAGVVSAVAVAGAGLFYFLMGGAAFFGAVQAGLLSGVAGLNLFAVGFFVCAAVAALAIVWRGSRFSKPPGSWRADYEWIPGRSRCEYDSALIELAVTASILPLAADAAALTLHSGLPAALAVAVMALALLLTGILWPGVRSHLAASRAVLTWHGGAPLRPGDDWEAFLELSRPPKQVSATLRHVSERLVKHRDRTVRERIEVLRVPVQASFETSGGKTRLRIRARFPALAPGTRLSAPPIRYWEIIVKADDGFWALFLVPLYRDE